MWSLQLRPGRYCMSRIIPSSFVRIRSSKLGVWPCLYCVGYSTCWYTKRSCRHLIRPWEKWPEVHLNTCSASRCGGHRKQVCERHFCKLIIEFHRAPPCHRACSLMGSCRCTQSEACHPEEDSCWPTTAPSLCWHIMILRQWIYLLWCRCTHPNVRSQLGELEWGRS